MENNKAQNKVIESEEPWLRKLVALLENWPDFKDLSNEQIAAELGISKRQFYRKMKELAGISPNLFIRRYRLNLAKKMLESHQFYTVQEIGQAVGYQNIHYFSKEFEKE
ncbi:MAG: helix-turn-helix domain-containing protein, partial [Bacteroidota bacterium]